MDDRTKTRLWHVSRVAGGIRLVVVVGMSFAYGVTLSSTCPTRRHALFQHREVDVDLVQDLLKISQYDVVAHVPVRARRDVAYLDAHDVARDVTVHPAPAGGEKLLHFTHEPIDALVLDVLEVCPIWRLLVAVDRLVYPRLFHEYSAASEILDRLLYRRHYLKTEKHGLKWRAHVGKFPYKHNNVLHVYITNAMHYNLAFCELYLFIYLWGTLDILSKVGIPNCVWSSVIHNCTLYVATVGYTRHDSSSEGK